MINIINFSDLAWIKLGATGEGGKSKQRRIFVLWRVMWSSLSLFPCLYPLSLYPLSFVQLYLSSVYLWMAYFIIDSFRMDIEDPQSRLDKAKVCEPQAKQTMLANRKDESPERQGDHKKKKKHREDRPSHSRSRDKKKREHSHSRDQQQRKHKKHHKHRDSKEKKHKRSADREKKHRHSSEHNRKHRDDRADKGDRGDRDRADTRDRGQYRDRRDNRDNRDRGDTRDNRDRGEYKDTRDRGDYRGNRDNRGDYRDNRDNRGGGGGGGGGNYNRDNRDRRDNGRVVVEEKDPYYERRRDIEKVRRDDPTKAEEMEVELEKQIIFDKKEKELEVAKEKFKEAQKQMEEAKREDMTILVYCLPLKAKEKEIWNFFIKANCGKIRDIRIIRDVRSGRSKGVAYVEFYNAESVQKALAMSDMPFELKGRHFNGLRVQHSQAEKNRAAAVAKQMRVIKPADPIEQQQEAIRRQTKVAVSGLVDKLSEMSEKDLKELFEPFGQIDYVDVHRDPQTGTCKGYAFLQYVDPEHAKVAVKAMNNLMVTGGQKITVQLVTLQQKGEITAHDEFLYSSGSKVNLMNKLSGMPSAPSFSNLMRPPISTVTTPYLIITGIFKMEGTSPAYFDTLKKDIQKQTEEYGVVERIFIEKNNQGNIWIKYSDTVAAVKAQNSMNGKYFDSHKIFMYFVTENTYQTRVGI